ncbi:hypothetical protein [Bacteroides acidifaciens]|uniref:hypothetical protein n=1 Tax=Bacteroides acidifaciens TaxID=85831 RepID=UPI00259CE8FA|nr:hypothetical protein [Bacteroides acidifaciens]
MELKNLNEATACLLQLIVDNNKLINENFVNVYTEYPDEPYFCDNLFIMYKWVNIKNHLDLEYELKKNKYFHSLRHQRINNQLYEIAVFSIPKELKLRKDILISGGPAELCNDEYKKVLNLFNGINSNIIDILFTNDFHEIKESIPIGDILENS